MSKDLDYSQVRSFNLGVAMDVTIEAAMIYDDLVYAQKIFGKGYFYRSYDMMAQRFPMLSVNTLRRHVAKLETAGYISTKIQKVNGSPVCHYQIERFLSLKMRDSMENAKLGDSIYKETKKETKSPDISFGANYSSAADRAAALLPRLLAIVNPKEKATPDRIRVLNGRLKDYTDDEILGAARAFSKSTWHIKNKQMSIDNLIAPSKFGRWYAQREDEAPAADMIHEPLLVGTPFPADWPRGKAEISRDDDDNSYFRGVKIDHTNSAAMEEYDRKRNAAN